MLRLIRNLGVQYWFEFPAAGVYALRIEGVHDKPRPVLLDVAVDGGFQGLVAYEKRNNEWDERSLPIRVPAPGFHTLAVNLVQAGQAAWDLQPDEETNAILGMLSLRRVPEGEPARDDRVAFGPEDRREPRIVPIPVVEPETGEVLPGWREATGKPFQADAVERRPLDFLGGPAVEVEVPHDSPGLTILAPVRPCSAAQQVVHAEALLGAFDLINHSATLGIVFLDENGRLMQGSPLFGQESILRTTDGHRFAVLAGVPPGAVQYAPILHVYQNGRRPARRPGWVRIGNVSIGEYP